MPSLGATTMKKLILGLLAAFLMTTGLVAFSGTSAIAAPPCGPDYPGCQKTATTSSAAVAGSGKATIKVTVKSVGSTKKPTGSVSIKIVKKGTSKAVYTSTKSVSGGKAKFVTGKLKGAKYTYKVTYKPTKKSIFKTSADGGSFKVK